MEINEPRKSFNWLLFAGVLIALACIVLMQFDGC